MVVPRKPLGFTLVEILIVVVILGVLAAIVTGSFVGLTDEAKRSAFIENLISFRDAAQLHWTRTGEYPEDSSSGQLPAGFEDLVDRRKFESGTPIGGVWDFEYQQNGITSGCGVHFNGTGETRDDAYMVQIDEVFDDGDLEDGAFQRIAAGRYYYIIEP